MLSGPLNVHWEMTNECNLACAHCYQQGDAGFPGLPTSEHLWTIARRIVEAEPFELTLTGGEPFLVPELANLLSFFDSNALTPHVTSNGGFITPDVCSWLRDLRVTVQISLDSADERTHDRLRRRRGAFRAATGAIRLLTSAGIETSVSYCATSTNFSDVRDVAELAHSLGVRKVCIGELIPTFGEREERQRLQVAPHQLRRVASDALASKHQGLPVEVSLISYSRPGGLHASAPGGVPTYSCSALRRDVAILYDGGVYPCPFARLPAWRIGDLTDRPLRDLWTSGPARAFREEFSPSGPSFACLVANGGQSQTSATVRLRRRTPPSDLQGVSDA